ncbi:hypothetical protein [Paenibacillus sp. L3-i20]|uniref:hypothetical protein n=1 Tax=Paenibacillus sp. L3-i20 TaxID=2905833 RepID=UPI001EE060E9|nr:hypothetical protein [Paenibacillus sp. L3-i20]GKU78064.1 hypothetical protein L3i20_v224610 [Paenibacillus sp. L3-i20]
MNAIKQQSTWLDDYLDLYNYADQINDSVWKEAIVETIRNGPSEEHADVVQGQQKEQLWREFNALNDKLIELFAIKKSSSSLFEIEIVQQLIQTLKQRRLEVGRLLV